ncbi:protein SIEVE ELEMENT OCCLUSION B-like [Bidens hawaiensis]|uniref:protein SIEVE ELEMENT OCCLUSION B-like n=1 Tax=Bidens hawaiensis TaxID=980011 RepID=UPI00404B8C41
MGKLVEPIIISENQITHTISHSKKTYNLIPDLSHTESQQDNVSSGQAQVSSSEEEHIENRTQLFADPRVVTKHGRWLWQAYTSTWCDQKQLMISNIHDHLKHQVNQCNHNISKKKKEEAMEAYLIIIRVMETPHLDNTKPLKHLIYLKDDQLPLYACFTKNRVSIDILKKKTVLLFISDLDLQEDELLVLDRIYQEARLNPSRAESHYEVVWLPVVPNHRTTPWTQENQSKFEALRNIMPWYSVFHPSLLDPAAIKYIKEVWHFNHKPLLVVMDPHGRIVNTNALHMMWIWGSVAFPFTSMREEALWREETWRIELLVDSIEPNIFTWVAEEKYICLYGGEDLEWIRRFTVAARAVASKARIPLEMLYVGKSDQREKVMRNNDIIRVEELSHVLPHPIVIWFFWVRLESMLHSKLQHRKSIDEDPILHEINVMLTYDENDQGWAVICHGSNDWMRRSDGRSVLMSLYKYSEWQDEAQSRGFLPALNEHLEANGRPMAPILRFPTRGDRHMFSSLDDNALMKNILATHAPDGTYFDVKPLLQIIEDITHRANLDKIPINGTQPEIDAIVEIEIDGIVESVIDNDVS